jgi:hypothetical protein
VRNSLNEACNKLTLCTYPAILYRVALKADNYSEKIVKIPTSAEPQHSMPRTYTQRNSSLFRATTNSFPTSILFIHTAILFRMHVDSAKWLPSLQFSNEISYVGLFLTFPKHNVPRNSRY